VFRPRRANAFADEVAIDFPSSRAAIECFRRDHVEPDGATATAQAEITISADQAGAGTRVPLEVSVPSTCACCGGRGEVWSEPCEPCGGRGQALRQQRLTVAVPPGVGHGDRFSFSVALPRGPRTRVDVTIAITA
jgi:DnaJ-class molecular chaperone